VFTIHCALLNMPRLSLNRKSTRAPVSKPHRASSSVQFARELHVSASAVRQWDAAVTQLSTMETWSNKMARRPYRRWFQSLAAADARLTAATSIPSDKYTLSSFALAPVLESLESVEAVDKDDHAVVQNCNDILTASI
jgi:hypothetical protein